MGRVEELAIHWQGIEGHMPPSPLQISVLIAGRGAAAWLAPGPNSGGSWGGDVVSALMTG